MNCERVLSTESFAWKAVQIAEKEHTHEYLVYYIKLFFLETSSRGVTKCDQGPNDRYNNIKEIILIGFFLKYLENTWIKQNLLRFHS